MPKKVSARKPDGKFAKGNKSGGRPQLPEHIKEIQRHTKPQIIEAYWKYANIALDEIENDEPVNLVEAGVKKCLFDFAKSGKTSEIKILWAECHGKPQESVDITSGEQAIGPVKITVKGA